MFFVMKTDTVTEVGAYRDKQAIQPRPMVKNSLSPGESQDKDLLQTQAVTPAGHRLRGLHWRVVLGVLPPFPASVGKLRRAAADGRRRYAELRRRLLVDPHIMEEVQKPHQLNMDNPLSQEPGSVWGRYFQNAELDRLIDNDLNRLYPEHGNIFQIPVYQAMLRRILLVWSLNHPHYSYRQGMHELLAPLFYVLQNDVMHLSEVKKGYEDLFDDRFDEPSLHESDAHGSEGKQKAVSFSALKAILVTEGSKTRSDDEWMGQIDGPLVELDEFGFNLQTMVLGSDTYGAEGELGALLSGRFMEHDAYCMFDALMRGQNGAVAMADYFMTVNAANSITGLSPVLEASAALFRGLAAADVSLYGHLVSLGVEPQFFALRWFRVLFGREFDLENLLLLWDAIFSAANTVLPSEEREDGCNIPKYSPRSAIILSVAMSMVLHLRPTLLSAPNATICLQKLLSFPQTVDIENLIENANKLQSLAEKSLQMIPSDIARFENKGGKLIRSRSGTPPFQGHVATSKNTILQHANSCSSEVLKHHLPDSYWETKWKKSFLQKVVPEDAYDVQNIETGATFVPVMEKSISCFSSQDNAEKLVGRKKLGSVMKEAVHSDHQGIVDCASGDGIISVRRKLFGESEDGSIPQSSSGDSDQESITISHQDLPASPHSGFSEPNSEQDSIDDFRVECFPSDKEFSVGSTLTGVNVESTGEDNRTALILYNECKEESSGIGRVADAVDGVTTAATSVHLQPPMGFKTRQNESSNDTSGSEVEEVASSDFEVHEAGPSVIAFDDQSSTKVIAKDVRGSSSPSQMSKGLASVFRFGNFFGMWNFGKSSFADKPGEIACSSKNEILKERMAVPANSAAKDLPSSKQGACSTDKMTAEVDGVAVKSDYCKKRPGSVGVGRESAIGRILEDPDELDKKITDDNELISDGSHTSTITKEKSPSAALQVLGQSLLDNIKVLETALSQRASTSTKEGLLPVPAASREKSELFSKTLLGGKKHVTVLAALAELRKISNVLSQM